MGGGVRGFEAASLIDGDVDHHRAFLHQRQHVAADQPGGAGAGDQHRADDQVGVAQRFADGVDVRGERDHLAGINVVEFAQAVQASLDDGDVRAQVRPPFSRRYGRRRRRRESLRSRARRRGRRPAGCLGRPWGLPDIARRPAPPCGPATSLMGVSSGRELSGFANGFVGDGVDLRLEQGICQLGQRRQVKIGEQRQAGAEEADIRRAGAPSP